MPKLQSGKRLLLVQVLVERSWCLAPVAIEGVNIGTVGHWAVRNASGICCYDIPCVLAGLSHAVEPIESIAVFLVLAISRNVRHILLVREHEPERLQEELGLPMTYYLHSQP